MVPFQVEQQQVLEAGASHFVNQEMMRSSMAPPLQDDSRRHRVLMSRWLLLLSLVVLTWHSAEAIYYPPNHKAKRVVQDLKVVLSDSHGLMFCRDCEDPLLEGSIGELECCCCM
jgi:hypothetical protein